MICTQKTSGVENVCRVCAGVCVYVCKHVCKYVCVCVRGHASPTNASLCHPTPTHTRMCKHFGVCDDSLIRDVIRRKGSPKTRMPHDLKLMCTKLGDNTFASSSLRPTSECIWRCRATSSGKG